MTDLSNQTTESGAAGPSFISRDRLHAAEAGAFDFADYLDWYQANGLWPEHAEAMRSKYEQITVPDSERAAIEAITGTYRLLATVDIGCPWVAANLTIVARIVAITPRIALRVLHRPDHLEIAYAYPGPPRRLRARCRLGR